MNTKDDFGVKMSNLSDETLLSNIKDKLSELYKTGGLSLNMSVPPKVDDFDMSVCELINRYINLLEENKKSNYQWNLILKKKIKQNSF